MHEVCIIETGMKQTRATKQAIERDDSLCQWCLKKRLRITRCNEGHHIWGRAAVDEIDGIITLCRMCHEEHGNGGEPTRKQLLEIMPEAKKYEEWSNRGGKWC